MTIAILIVISILFIASAQNRGFPRSQAQTDRVQTMDSYLTNLERDLPRAAYIAGFRSLIGLEEHVSHTSSFVSDVDSLFVELFVNGSANETSYGIMDNSTFTNFTSAFSALAARQGMQANLTTTAVEAYQDEPWSVRLNITVLVELSDRAGTARFNQTMKVQAEVPIESIRDPLYTIGTAGRAPRPITRSDIVRPYIDASNDTTKLQQLVDGALYTASSNAPSFLQRFSGDLSASPYGIQSLVDLEEFEAQGMPLDECKSVVDYLYLGTTDTDPNYEVINMDADRFWLDDGSLEDYDADGKTVGITPC